MHMSKGVPIFISASAISAYRHFFSISAYQLSANTFSADIWITAFGDISAKYLLEYCLGYGKMMVINKQFPNNVKKWSFRFLICCKLIKISWISDKISKMTVFRLHVYTVKITFWFMSFYLFDGTYKQNNTCLNVKILLQCKFLHYCK